MYQAHNGHYLGRSTKRTLHLLPDGAVFSARAASKVRRREVGWQYAVEQLVTAGAEPPSSSGDLREWLTTALGALRRLQHPGNHRYAWGLHRAVKLASTLPFPKRGL